VEVEQHLDRLVRFGDCQALARQPCVGGRLRDLLSLFAFKYVAGIIYVCEARRREGLRGAELKIMHFEASDAAASHVGLRLGVAGWPRRSLYAPWESGALPGDWDY